MDEIKLSFQPSWDGIAHSSDGLFPGLRVSEYGEVRVKEFVRLADGKRNAQPVSRRSNGSGTESGLVEPRVHAFDGLGSGGNECFHL